jgi:hypothetical protein
MLVIAHTCHHRYVHLRVVRLTWTHRSEALVCLFFSVGMTLGAGAATGSHTSNRSPGSLASAGLPGSPAIASSSGFHAFTGSPGSLVSTGSSGSHASAGSPGSPNSAGLSGSRTLAGDRFPRISRGDRSAPDPGIVPLVGVLRLEPYTPGRGYLHVCSLRRSRSPCSRVSARLTGTPAP